MSMDVDLHHKQISLYMFPINIITPRCVVRVKSSFGPNDAGPFSRRTRDSAGREPQTQRDLPPRLPVL